MAISYVLTAVMTISYFAIRCIRLHKMYDNDAKKKGFESEYDPEYEKEFYNDNLKHNSEGIKNGSIHAGFLKAVNCLINAELTKNHAKVFWNRMATSQFHLFWIALFDLPSDGYMNETIEMLKESPYVCDEYKERFIRMVNSAFTTFRSIDCITKEHYATEDSINAIIAYAKQNGTKPGSIIESVDYYWELAELFKLSLIDVLKEIKYDNIKVDGNQIGFDEEKDDPFEVARNVMKYMLAN